jgi:transposase InsO family protein
VQGELYDSRVSRHMSPFGQRFANYKTILPHPITAADKRIFYAVGMGDLRIEVPNGKSSTPIGLKDVLHALDMGIIIVSVSCITQSGCKVIFDVDVCHIFNRAGTPIGAIHTDKHSLYKAEHIYVASIPDEWVNIAIMHRCLAHIAPDSIQKMVKRGIVEGVQLINDSAIVTCKACEQAKATHKEIWKEHEVPLSDVLGKEIHSDVWGHSPVPSLGGRRYYVTFTDDFYCHTWLTTMHTKDETLAAYKAYAAWFSTQHGVKIKWLHSDHGGEYTGKVFSRFLAEQGTKRRLTMHDTPQHNGVAESLNHCLMECMRAFLIQAILSKSLWVEVSHFIIWLKNCSITHVLGDATPHECLMGCKPNLAGLLEWGPHMWVYAGKSLKLGKHAALVHWISYNKGSPHAHRIYWPDMQSVTAERNVRFTADFTTVYTLPGPVHNQPPTSPVQSALPPADTTASSPDTSRITATTYATTPSNVKW